MNDVGSGVYVCVCVCIDMTGVGSGKYHEMCKENII